MAGSNFAPYVLYLQKLKIRKIKEQFKRFRAKLIKFFRKLKAL